jgi:hypothetical protein
MNARSNYILGLQDSAAAIFLEQMDQWNFLRRIVVAALLVIFLYRVKM